MKITKELKMPKIQKVWEKRPDCLYTIMGFEVDCRGIDCGYCALRLHNLREYLKQQREDK